MSSALDILNQKWKQFQQASEGSDVSHNEFSKHLLTYKQIQQDTKTAYLNWQKEHNKYQALLDAKIESKPTHTTNGTNSLTSLIVEHDELANQIQHATESPSSSVPLQQLMQLWERLTVVHHLLSEALQKLPSET